MKNFSWLLETHVILRYYSFWLKKYTSDVSFTLTTTGTRKIGLQKVKNEWFSNLVSSL